MLNPNNEPNTNINSDPNEKPQLSKLNNTDFNSGLPQSTTIPEDPEFLPRWYVLRVQTGKEDKVRSNLEARIQSMGMADKIFKVLVPTEKVVDPKKGKRVSYRKMYPGYVMVEMIKTEQTHYMVKNTPGVGDFAGSMTDAEVERMLLTCEHAKEKPQNKTPAFYKGQQVRIKEGSFENYIGVVDEIDEPNSILKLQVEIFSGSSTKIELQYQQVEDISNSAT